MKLILTVIFLGIWNWSGAQDYYISSGGKILTIDPTTCTETVVCNNIPVNTGGGTTSGNIGDIAFHPNGNLYGLMSNYFISIDLTNCTSTTISQHTTNSNALVADASGNIYAAHDSLYSVDPVTGVFTALGELPCTSGGDLAFHGGNLYMTCMNGDLLEVNISNPIASVILGNLGTGNWYGLWTAHTDCNNSVLLAANQNDIYELDLSTVGTTFQCALGTWTWVEGATMAGDFLASDCGCPLDLGPDTTFCAGSITLDATGTNYTYQWSTGAMSPTINVNSAGTYYVDITEPVSGCTNTDTIVVTQGTSANAGMDYVINICGTVGAFNLLDSIPGNPDAGGIWNGPSALSGADQGTFDPSANAFGTYDYVVAGSGGCAVDTASVTVSNNVSPFAGDDVVVNLCSEDLTLNLYASITNNPDAGGTWSGPSALSNAYLGTFDPSSSAPGTYYYIVGSTSCGLDSTLVSVIVNMSPVLWVSNDTIIDSGGTAYLDASGADTYVWTPNSSLTCSNCASPDATPSETTVYTVTGTSNGCSASKTITVTIKYGTEIFIPTAFSPNGDGLNDTYGVISTAFKSANFQVFDRWGKLVFETNDLSQKWLGLIKGEPAMGGTYHYVLTGVLQTNEIVKMSGNVSLIR